ncbi:MAG TPA: filamentous hemagglutinin N-terminal domain-containing protein, partial [Candidatus Ratteibacteria bacterium]|nr:filamentous hemagglutinin N-terminal domain-containing protein [Candidatus Ratteibacteria bacterium]
MKVRKSILIGRFFLLVASGGLLFPMQALPLPQNGNVAAGQAEINQAGNQMTITQSSGKTIINWDSYSINTNELVQYLQPGANAISLNRVVGQNPSAILGQLIANGQVWIVNPNGVFFGKEATVNVAGLMATTLNISDSNFLNGNYEFSQQENSPLSYIINQGKIIINDNGYAVLVAPLVSNEGLIVANLGKVRIGAAEKFSVNFDGSNLVNFAISNPPDGQTPGTVLIPQSQITDVIKEVVNIPALIEAGDIVEEDGVVKLVSASGTAINTGTIKADGAVGENAGSIVIDSTQATAIGPESLLTAKGTGENSSGGEIKILSSMQDGVAMITPGATLEAKGGDTGDGGFIELSGRDFYLGNAVIDVSAPMGQTGIFLLDPYNVEITSADENGIWTGGDPNTFTPDGSPSRVSDETIEFNLLTANVIISTNGAGTEEGNITLYSTIDYNGPNYLRLVADNNIVFNTGTINFTGTGNVYLIADSDYSGVGAILNTGEQTITLGGGRLLMVAGTGIGTSDSPILTSGVSTLSAYNSTSGDININNTGDLTIDDWTGGIG